MDTCMRQMAKMYTLVVLQVMLEVAMCVENTRSICSEVGIWVALASVLASWMVVLVFTQGHPKGLLLPCGGGGVVSKCSCGLDPCCSEACHVSRLTCREYL